MRGTTVLKESEVDHDPLRIRVELFECLVYNNIRQIIRRIGLDQTLILSAAPYVQNPTARAAGCQIDLLVQTRRMLYVVEIKRRESVGEWVVSEVEEKLSKLKTPSNVSVIPVLVYDGNLSRRVPADGYFGCVISARELLGLPCGAASEAAD